jgi:N-acetylneuraminic acid mutarotase
VDGHIDGHRNYFDEYDPVSKKWKVLEDAPRERDHFQASVVKHHLFVAGGRRTKAPYGTFDLVISDVDYYYFVSNTWSTFEKDLPTPRAQGYSLHLIKYKTNTHMYIFFNMFVVKKHDYIIQCA